MLNFLCPRCAHIYEDPYEALGINALSAIQCEACGRAFWVAIMECDSCANEEAFAWSDEPPNTMLDSLVCGACQSYLRYRDHPGVTDVPNPER